MENTVLIVGAGFSKPYGYPSGPELLTAIKQNYKNSPTAKEVALSKSVRDFAPKSIDRFLNENSDYYEVGIQVIISEILRYEHESFKKNDSTDDDVIADILNIVDSADNDLFEKVRFITFNYDRLLEWRILQRLKVRYGNDIKTIHDKFSKVSIEHIHGSLPSLVSNQNEDPFRITYGLEGYNSQERTYAHHQLKEWAIRNKSIKTVFSNSVHPTTKTIDTLKWGTRIFFLGFAFEELNMRKLGIGAPGIHYAWNLKTVGGTVYGIPSIDLKRILKTFPFLKSGLYNTPASQIFKEFYDLVDPSIDHLPRTKEYDCCEINAFQEQPPFDPVITTTRGYDLKCPRCGKKQIWRYKHGENQTLHPFRFLPNF